MTKTLSILAAAAAVTLAIVPAADAASGRVKARGANGGFAAGTHNGNSYARGWGVRQNADGSTTYGSGGAFRLNNGAAGVRGSTTTVNPDGSATRQGGFAASGSKGSVTSQGSATRSADGTLSGSRNTDVTAANGNTYSGTTTYDPATGVTHTATCRDASGGSISCPSR